MFVLSPKLDNTRVSCLPDQPKTESIAIMDLFGHASGEVMLNAMFFAALCLMALTV